MIRFTLLSLDIGQDFPVAYRLCPMCAYRNGVPQSLSNGTVLYCSGSSIPGRRHGDKLCSHSITFLPPQSTCTPDDTLTAFLFYNVTSSIGRLPDEVVREILSYVMIHDTPFDLGDCIRTAAAVDLLKKPGYKANVQTAQDEQYFQMSTGAFCLEELSKS